MQIYTVDGKLIGEVGEQRRIPVKLADVPQRLIDAFSNGRQFALRNITD